MTVNSTEWKIGQFIRQPGFILAILNFWIGLIWMAAIQPLDAPDEPGHLQAIIQVRKQHILPEIHYAPGNYSNEIPGPPADPETAVYVTKFLPNLPVTEKYFVLPYESFQPPLYYLSAGTAAQLFPPKPQVVLYVGRLIAVLFGAATVYFCWLITRQLAPQAYGWAAASAGVVALLPQFCFNSAHASNDSTIGLTAAAAFYVWIRGLRNAQFDRRLLLSGAMLGLALLAKLTAVALIPGLVLVILFRIFQVRPAIVGMVTWLKRSVYMIIGATVGTVLGCGWWFLRNIFTYGEPSGSTAALRFFASKFMKADFTLPRTARDLVRYTFESIWGRFGWNDITLSQEVYRLCNIAALILVSLSVLAGIRILVLWIIRRRSPDITWQAFLIFLVIGITLLVSYIQFNKSIAYQPQARYFLILLVPSAMLMTGGLCMIAATPPLRVIAFSILFIALGVLNGLALVTVMNAGTATGGVRHHVSVKDMLPCWSAYLS